MKVNVDDERCAGHGHCWALCPEVFDLHDHGYAVVQVETVPPELEDKVRTAVDRCPEHAISTTD